MLHLQRQLSLGDFFKLLEEGGPQLSQAANLLQVYARAQNRELLRDFWFQEDRRVDLACLSLDDAMRAPVRWLERMIAMPFANFRHLYRTRTKGWKP